MIKLIERIFGFCIHDWQICEVWTKRYENQYGEEIYMPTKIKRCIKCNKIIKY